MQIVTKHIIKTVVHSSLIVMAALVAVEVFLLLIGEVPSIGKGDYHFGVALAYVLLNIPSDVYQIFPMIMLLGSLMGLGQLATSHELVVLRASGVSRLQITFSVIKAALLLFVLAFFIGEGLGPASQHYANTLKTDALAKKTLGGVHEGIWIRDHNSFVHIDEVKPHHQLRGIARFKFDDANQLKAASYAEKGYLFNDQWFLDNVKISRFTPEGITTNTYAHQIWPVSFDLRMIEANFNNTDELPLVKLRAYIAYREHSGLNTTHYWFAFWQRVLKPISTIVMICLAVPFIFGSQRSASTGLRIIGGIVIAFIFYMLNAFFGPFSMLYQIPPLLAAALPSLLVLLMGGLIASREAIRS